VLLIPVRCDRSPLHGLGLFAVHPIPEGTPVWRFVPGFDRTFPASEIAHLPPPAQQHLAHYGFLDASRDLWHLDGDLAIFMNHSPNPNTGAPECSGPAPQTRALRDIAAGEELTCDYHAFDNSPKPIGPHTI